MSTTPIDVKKECGYHATMIFLVAAASICTDNEADKKKAYGVMASHMESINKLTSMEKPSEPEKSNC